MAHIRAHLVLRLCVITTKLRSLGRGELSNMGVTALVPVGCIVIPLSVRGAVRTVHGRAEACLRRVPIRRAHQGRTNPTEAHRSRAACLYMSSRRTRSRYGCDRSAAVVRGARPPLRSRRAGERLADRSGPEWPVFR